MNLLPKQIDAVRYLKDDHTQELLYGGASGGGKTALGCLWLIESCQKYPESRWLIGRSKLKNLRETTLNTFFELSKRLDITEQYTYNSQKQIILFNNGSEILLKDLFLYPSDPEFDSLGSLEITGAFIDECNQINYKAWQIVKSRIRYKLEEFNRIPKMLGTCNPAKNWVYHEFYLKDRNNDLPNNRRFIQALPKDNPHLHPSYLEALLSLDSDSKERLYYGNWLYDNDPSALIKRDAIDDYFNPVHLSKGDKKYLTIDVARYGKDKTVFRVWEGWLCTKRYELPKSSVSEVVDMAKSIMSNHAISLSNTVADEDGVGGGVVDFLKCKGFVNNSKALKGQNYANLKSQCSIEMAKMIQSREAGEIADNGTTKDLIVAEMEQVKMKNLDSDTKLTIIPKEMVKEKIGRSPDDWDSIMMRYYFELKKGDYFIVC
ncbi:MAG: phage terminase large subunit [Allomuricauda sp.]